MGSMDFLMSRRLRISSFSFSRIAINGATVDWVDRDCKPIIGNCKMITGESNILNPWTLNRVNKGEEQPYTGGSWDGLTHPGHNLDSPVTSVSFSFFFFNVLIDLIKCNQIKIS